MKRICFLVDSIFSIGGVQRVTAVIAKELAKTYDVTIVTFDHPKDQDTNLYGLDEASIHYRFFAYPSVGYIYQKICKAYSGFYLKYGLQSKWASNIYAHSSFPAPLKKALTKTLQNGNYDVIIGGIANDKVFRTVDLYFAGDINKDECLRRLIFEEPNNQICIRSQQVLDECLTFKCSKSL